MKRTAAVIAGLGGYVPQRVLTNDALARRLGTSDEWIRSRTGIRQRRLVEPGMGTSDVAIEAGVNALESAGVARADAVLLATTTPDNSCPATAPTVATRLGLTDAAAFDLNAGCSGFVYGLSVAGALIGAGQFRSVLLIGADIFSTVLDPADRTTRALIGDGAGAVLLRAGDPAEEGAVLTANLGSDGSGADLLIVPGTGSRQRSTGRHPALAETYFRMEGRAVFSNAVTRMSASITELLREVGWDAGEIVLVPHQANMRILTAVGGQIDVPVDHLVSNIDRLGNTAAASIPLALVEGVDTGLLKPTAKVVISAFGAGLTWGSAAFTWPAVEPVINERPTIAD